MSDSLARRPLSLTHLLRMYLYISDLGIVGKYAVNKKDRERGFFSQALCAYRAEFRFRTFGTVLDYLDGRVFTAREPAFLSLFGY